MKEETLTDNALRQYLLGKVADEELEQIENLYLTDSQIKERVLAAEQDLIEDYLENNLATAERETFVSRYAQTAQQRRKLGITRSIKKWAAKNADNTTASVENPDAKTAFQTNYDSLVSQSARNRFPFLLRWQPTLVIPIAIGAIVLIVVAAFLLNSRRESQERLVIEQQLAQLNSITSLSEVPAQMISVELRPVSIRGDGQQPEIKLSDRIRVIELQLPWIQKEFYATYEAELRGLREQRSFLIRSVHGNVSGPGSAPLRTIRVRLPTDILRTGEYQLELSGVGTDGTKGPTEEYTFVVSN
jgi:hypothetical protein